MRFPEADSTEAHGCCTVFYQIACAHDDTFTRSIPVRYKCPHFVQAFSRWQIYENILFPDCFREMLRMEARYENSFPKLKEDLDPHFFAHGSLNSCGMRLQYNRVGGVSQGNAS